MALDPQTLSGLPAADFVALVNGMSDDQIRRDLGGPDRSAVLDQVFARFPEQFRAEKAGSRSARIDFHITGGPGDALDTYAVVVENGTCTVEKDPTAASDLSLQLGPAEFLTLITGTGNPAMMFLMGKVKAKGDLGLATSLSAWFEAPRA